MRRVPPPARSLSGEAGFTLIEVLAAAVLLMVGVLGTVKLIDAANAQTVTNQGREAATNLAREVVEQAAQLDYSVLTADAVGPALQGLPGLGSTGGPGWTVKRRRFEHTLTATACTLDDRADGFGTGHDARWCPGTPTTTGGILDGNPDDMRRVTVTVTWGERGQRRSVRQSAVIPNPGNAAGPAITSLTHPNWSPATTPDPSQIVFVAQATPTTTRTTFAVDGAPPQAGLQRADGRWEYTWDAGTKPDGTYLISAQAFDVDGRSRGPNVVSVRLNRRLATAPTPFAGGRNLRLASTVTGATIVDLDWSPSPEPDVVGYRVYRNTTQTRTGATLVCTTGLSESLDQQYGCSDPNAPTTTPIHYGIVALDPDPADDAATRESETRWVRVDSGNRAPKPPEAITFQVDAVTGLARFSWSLPTAPVDPDGDAIRYFRIYRVSGNSSVTSPPLSARYDRTGTGTTVRWTDTERPAPPYTYWLVTVDARFGESTAVRVGSL